MKILCPASAAGESYPKSMQYMRFPASFGVVAPFFPQEWKTCWGPAGASHSVDPGRGDTAVVVLAHRVPTPLYRIMKFHMISDPVFGSGNGMPGRTASTRSVSSLLSLAAPAAFFRMFASIHSGYPALRWLGYTSIRYPLVCLTICTCPGLSLSLYLSTFEASMEKSGFSSLYFQ